MTVTQQQSHHDTHTHTHYTHSGTCWLVFEHSQWGSAESTESSFVAWHLEYGSGSAGIYASPVTHTHTHTHTRTLVLCWLVFAHSQWGSAVSTESSFVAWYLDYGSGFAGIYASTVTHTHIHALWYYAGWYLRTLNGAARNVLNRVSWRGI